MIGVGFITTVIAVWGLRKALISPQRRKWLSHNIHDYNVTLRNGKSLDFVGSELGDEVTLIVRDGNLVDVIAPFEIDNIKHYQIYTLDELFQHILFEAQYDSVYGFPTRIIGWRDLAIEVINFEPKASEFSNIERKDEPQWLSNNNPSV